MSEQEGKKAKVEKAEATEVELKPLPWVNRSTRAYTRPLRTVKMLKPRCEVCSPQGGDWWKRCRHKPFENETYIDEEVVTTEPHPDGGEAIIDRQVVRRRISAPNVIEVPLEKKINSGLGVASAIAKGAQPLSSGGYAPVCEFAGCYESNPQVQTRLGVYCTEYEARLIAARNRGIPLSINNQDTRTQQLERIAL